MLNGYLYCRYAISIAANSCDDLVVKVDILFTKKIPFTGKAYMTVCGGECGFAGCHVLHSYVEYRNGVKHGVAETQAELEAYLASLEEYASLVWRSEEALAQQFKDSLPSDGGLLEDAARQANVADAQAKRGRHADV